ncbi:hypothetical protein F2Q70_00038228 [Brassica cretica]|uniref:Uncharacterized protein n=1 Tax=Brassica cretica TaxID=69181 RepID=A0A8S9K896_BRACR|nr:hypothetical protein F2Q70_00038228 [Brassica cretica]
MLHHVHHTDSVASRALHQVIMDVTSDRRIRHMRHRAHWGVGPIGASGPLGRLARWGVWPVGASGPLGRLARWGVWPVGASGPLGRLARRLARWGVWPVGPLGRLAHWGVWPIGASGPLGRLTQWDVWSVGKCLALVENLAVKRRLVRYSNTSGQKGHPRQRELGLSGEEFDLAQINEEAVDELYKGRMPNLLSEAKPDDRLRFDEVQEQDIRENDWLRLYTDFALYCYWQYNEVAFKSCFPAEINKILVETFETHRDPSLKVKSSNAIFHINFTAKSWHRAHWGVGPIGASGPLGRLARWGVWPVGASGPLGRLARWDVCNTSGQKGNPRQRELGLSAIDELYKGRKPNLLSEAKPDDRLRFDEVQEQDIRENDWLRLYTDFALYCHWQYNEVAFKSCLPAEINKILVETFETHRDPSLKVKSSNAIFHINFTAKSCDYISVVRRITDGRTGHIILEISTWTNPPSSA